MNSQDLKSFCCMTNSDKTSLEERSSPNRSEVGNYKRPRSAETVLSLSSVSSHLSHPTIDPLNYKRDILGTIFLSVYVFCGLVATLVSLVYLLFLGACLMMPGTSPIPMSPLINVILQILTFAAFLMCVSIPTSMAFAKPAAFTSFQKRHRTLFYGSGILALCGVLNVVIHFIYADGKYVIWTAGVPAGIFMLLYSGLSLKIFFELVQTNNQESVLLPYCQKPGA